MSSLDSFFSTVKLPSISEVAHQLIKTLNNEKISVTQVRDIIAQDPALTAKLLRLANSAEFGLPRGVGSLDAAIQMVGMARVRTLSLGACMSESFPALPGLNLQEFWHTSMACAAYAQWLAAALGMDAQQAWLTGMMLRLGELLIGQADPGALAEIERLPHLPGARWEREKRLIGFSEGQVTAKLARLWNFPMQISQALERAYDPLVDQAFSRLGAVLHLAGILADIPAASAEAVDTLPHDVLAALALDVAWMKTNFPRSDVFINVS
ncbi:HDOD domain protein [mine drainage metagenome]|uniref:HDOD domain protein n=1 Tax=mine drainage metagenome TaxID=410659 RepID=A0A1J5PSG5_9ZZZZ